MLSCFFADSSSKVLVITGYPYDESIHSEVIDVGNEDLTCQDFTDAPYKIEGGTGGLINNKIVICGGYDDHHGTDKCWILGEDQTISMKYEREYASSIELPLQSKVSFFN